MRFPASMSNSFALVGKLVPHLLWAGLPLALWSASATGGSSLVLWTSFVKYQNLPAVARFSSRAVDKLCQVSENKTRQHPSTETLDIKQFCIVYNSG